MQYTALAPDLGQVFKQQHQITRVETAFMNRLALSPSGQIRLPKLDGTEPGTPSHRYHPRPTDLTRMLVNSVCRKTIGRFGDPAGLSRVDDRTFNHQIAILRPKTEFSSTYHSEAGGTGGTIGTGGT
jgi:hypothetical protein